jgi:hypothetical protein
MILSVSDIIRLIFYLILVFQWQLQLVDPCAPSVLTGTTTNYFLPEGFAVDRNNIIYTADAGNQIMQYSD